MTENHGSVGCSFVTNSIAINVVDEFDISAYPNPANQSFTVQLPFAATSSTYVKVINQMGQIKYTGYINTGQVSKLINCGAWVSRYYIITLTQGSNGIQKTISVQH